MLENNTTKLLLIVQAKTGNHSMEVKKLCRKAYRQKKKNIVWRKYYEKLSEDSLKKCYRSIPIEDRLPIGIMESDHDVLDKISSAVCN